MTSNPGDLILAPPRELSTKPASQLLDETLTTTDELVQFLGGEWLDNGSPRSVFDPTDKEGWSFGACNMSGTSGQYSVVVHQLQDPATFDPDPVTEKVRTLWEERGYTVRQLGPAEADTEERFRSISVDLRYNAGFSFNASTTGMGIEVTSECIAWD